MKQVNVRLPDAVKQLATADAKKNHWSVNTWVYVAIQEKLDRSKKENESAAA